MVVLQIRTFDDVSVARACARDLASAAGVADPSAVAQAAGELGNNCVEHGDPSPALLWIACGPGRLSLRFENACSRRPTWQTRKPVAIGDCRSGGYGLPIARSLARVLSLGWCEGRAVVRAEFS